MTHLRMFKAAIGAGLLLTAAAAAWAAGQTAPLEQRYPAAGAHIATVHIEAPGRYRLSASSSTGVALRVVSRLRGPGAWHGLAGQRDGSVDALLDSGRYRVELRGAQDAPGEVRLRLEAFAEKSTQAARLERGSVRTTLADLEQRAYVLEVARDGPVFLEAAGRALGALAIWRDNGWLLHADLNPEQRTPRKARPVRVARLAVSLPAGRYRVVAYGARPLAWDRASAEPELHLRRGLPVLGPAHAGRHRVSAFGVDRYLVPAVANRVHLMLPGPGEALLRAQPFRPAQPFADGGQSARIERDMRVPGASLQLPRNGRLALEDLARGHFGALPAGPDRTRYWQPPDSDDAAALQAGADYDLLTVEGAAGEAYRLQVATDRRRIVWQRTGRFLINALPVGAARDHGAITGLLFAGPRREARHPLRRSGALTLRRADAWRRQFNLQADTELWLRVHQAGDYRFTGKGVAARYELHPYGSDKSVQVRTFGASDATPIPLARGYYRLRIRAPDPGVHALRIAGEQASATRAMPSAARFQDVQVGQGQEAIVSYAPAMQHLAMNVRRLPLDLRVPVPLVLDPGEAVSLPVRVASAATLYVRHDGDDDDVKLSSGADAGGGAVLEVQAGSHEVRLQSQAAAPLTVTLAASVPDAIPKPTRPAPGPVLRPGTDLELSLRRGQSGEVWIEVPEDGNYWLRSSGLLQVAARLHTQVALDLSVRSANGSGRNFSLLRSLSRGRYRLNITPQGRTEGVLGLHMRRANAAAPASVAAGHSLARVLHPGEYWPVRLPVVHAGHYRLRVLGRDWAPAGELHAPGGWPLLPNGGSPAGEFELAAGEHVLAVFGGRSARAVVVDMQVLQRPRTLSGHGPHELVLGKRIAHRWMSGANDVWQFSLPVHARLEVLTSASMAGTLHTPDGTGISLDTGRVTLAQAVAGDYRLEVSHARGSNRRDYHVLARTAELLPGQQRGLSAPAQVPVAVPASGIVQLRSYGGADVRAELVDEGGRILASSDDDGADWNFRLALRTEQQRLSLRVVPVAAAKAATTVRFEAPGDARAVDTSATRTYTESVDLVFGGRGLELLRVDGPGAPYGRGSGLRGAHLQGASVFASYGVQRTLAVPGAARTRRRDFTVKQVSAARLSNHELAGGGAIAMALGEGPKRVVMDLPAGVFALLGDDTVGADDARHWTVDTGAGTLLLMNAGARARHLAVDVQPLAASHRGDVAVLHAAADGWWRPAAWLAQDAAAVVHLAGSLHVGAQTPAVPAVHDFAHRAGAAWLWRDAAERWVDSPAVPLAALRDGLRVEGALSLSLPVQRSTLLDMRSTGAIAWRLPGLQAGAVAGGRLLLAVPAGARSLQLSALGEAVHVEARTVASAELAEGLSAPVWLAPGAGMAFRFVLEEAARIGVGGSAEGGGPLAVLLDPTGALRAGRTEQVVQRELAPGAHTLVLVNRAVRPQLLRAALVGSRAPEPLPQAVVRNYLRRYTPPVRDTAAGNEPEAGEERR